MRDDLTVLERAYDVWASPRDWQRALTEAIHHATRLPGGWGSALVGPAAHAIDPHSGVFVDVEDDRLPRALLHPWDPSLLPIATRCSTTSQDMAAAGPSEASRFVLDYWAPQDSLYLIAFNPDGTGICFGSVLPRPTRLTRSFVRHWLRIATHAAAGLRLRRSLQSLAAPAAASADRAEGEAVLDPAGRALHAAGSAETAAARAALRRAVQAVEQARGRLRRQDPAAAVQVWRGLVSGRWSLVDRYESGGRRYYVAHRNVPDVPAQRALHRRELQVVAYAAQGHSNKHIAYTLGLSTSTVGAYLASARKKLGASGRTELVRLARLFAVGADGVGASTRDGTPPPASEGFRGGHP